MKQIHDAITDLTTAYEDFRITSHDRLKRLEEKSVPNPDFERVGDMTERLERVSDRLAALPLRHLRPMGQMVDSCLRPEEREQKKAFRDYVCSGDERSLQSLERKGLSTLQNEEGGFAVPQLVVERIREEMNALSPLRRLAQTLTISTSAVDLLIDHGHAEVGWVQEMAARSETATPSLRKLTIPVHEMYANPRASQKLLDDSHIDVESWLVRSIATRMAQMENMAFIRGDGQHKPRGFLTYPTAVVGQGAYGVIEYIDAGSTSEPPLELMSDLLMETVEALKPVYHKGAVWLMSRSVFALIRRIRDRHGHYLLQQSMQLGAPHTLLGYPIEISEDMPSFAPEQNPTIAFGNFKETYQIVDRST
ncbi:MAG: phage major capsid protein, partial [Alphaproteobacteria bacterium]|nr:phage major capsid protein [Alphaproteobacteria bacterium]